ncbi:MAG: NTP transferase domain-containing protein [Erysipelotrichaceae bacterium]|nr:NTP transferase domain-containing protein [Erysipelotrichaceae bacterium]
MDYRQYLVNKDCKIKDAMKKLDSVKPKILFVAENEIMIGALTDGDIRRYLFNGGNVEESVDKACNRNPKRVASSLEEAITLLDKNYIAIPIIDEKKKILDIYTGKKAAKARKKKIDIPVVINAGGKGTRLDPFTKILPKPLIPVGDLPIIEHIMRRYEEAGCSAFHIIVNYKKELIKSYFKEIDKEYKITWTDEIEPLGTGGGLSLLKNKIKDTFFFICCDSLILNDYSEIVKFHKKNKNDITMICARKHVTIPYGIVNVDKKDVLDSIEEKPEYSFLTNTAMYIVEPVVLKDLKKNVRIDFPDIIRMEKEKGRKIGVYTVEEEDWLDMGQMSELEKMRIRLYGE